MGCELGYLKSLDDTKCPHLCGTKLTLKPVPPSYSDGLVLQAGDLEVKVPTACRYYCTNRVCNGSKHGCPVLTSGRAVRIALGGRGRAPAGEGLLVIALASLPWHDHHPSLGNCTLIQGISKSSTQLYLDAVTWEQARQGKLEQKHIVFVDGERVEWDEAGVRAERIKCVQPCRSATSVVDNYRLLWNRWLIGVLRGNRSRMVVKQMPFKSTAASGGGVPICDSEVDTLCFPHLSKGVICLTDGAQSYEAFADGEITCSPDCQRIACLNRARREGKEPQCLGSRPRAGRDRYNATWKPLRLSHGVVSHTKDEWATVKEITIFGPNRSCRRIKLKHGTEVADGAWGPIKRSFPDGVHSSDHDRIATYIHAWAWRARRFGCDLFHELPQGF